jgi:putative transposase
VIRCNLPTIPEAEGFLKRPGRVDRSIKSYRSTCSLEYPAHDWTAVITACGRICHDRRKINVSQVFAGQKVGVKQTDEHLRLVTFMDYDLGYFDDETCRLEPINNPFGPKLLPMSPE